MSDQFNSWWHNGEPSTDNPYEPDSAAYWAWEGWCAAVNAEREACAKVCDEMEASGALSSLEKYRTRFIADAIRARGQE